MVCVAKPRSHTYAWFYEGKARKDLPFVSKVGSRRTGLP